MVSSGRAGPASGAPERPVPARELLPRVVGLFRPHRTKVSLLLGAIAIAATLGIANPLVTKVVFDRALFPPEGGPRLGLLAWLVGLMIGLVVLAGAVGIGQTYLATLIGQRVMHDLRSRLYEHLQGMSLRFFSAARTGEIQSRIANDVGGVGRVVTDAAPSILMNLAIGVSSIVAMSVLSWQLTLLSLAILPAFIYLVRRVGKLSRRLSSYAQQTLAEMSVITEETLSVSGALQTKLFGSHRDASERYRDRSERLAGLRIRQEMVVRVLIGVAQTFFIVAPAILYLVAGHLRASGVELTAGTLVAFTALQVRLFGPVRALMETTIDIATSFALFERIFEYVDLQHEIVDRPGAARPQKERVAGTITFDHVCFRYPGSDPRATAELESGPGNGRRDERPWTLEDICLEIAPGQLAALVGPSGAGKTTLAYLIPRLYDVQTGSVRIDAMDVQEISLASLTELVGLVTQETHLFHATLAENLRYARPGASHAELEAAARTANIHERIFELENGYDTLVGERGYRMSGGEKQRLAIARVLLRDPKILILDEATSSLDTVSERLVQAALEPLRTKRTTIAIAHRLSTILSADVIFVLDRGRIVERGRHDELVSLGGRYAQLYEQQFQHGVVEARCQDGVVLASGEVVTLGSQEAESGQS